MICRANLIRRIPACAIRPFGAVIVNLNNQAARAEGYICFIELREERLAWYSPLAQVVQELLRLALIAEISILLLKAEVVLVEVHDERGRVVLVFVEDVFFCEDCDLSANGAYTSCR